MKIKGLTAEVTEEGCVHVMHVEAPDGSQHRMALYPNQFAAMSELFNRKRPAAPQPQQHLSLFENPGPQLDQGPPVNRPQPAPQSAGLPSSINRIAEVMKHQEVVTVGPDDDVGPDDVGEMTAASSVLGFGGLGGLPQV